MSLSSDEWSFMKQILAFGDSNTWGLIPGTWDRYPEYVRWTGILRKAVVSKGRRILEDGLVGRTTVFDDPARPLRRGIDSIPRYREEKDLDAVILMLGTNDCKNVFRPTPEKIGEGLEQCLDCFENFVPPEKILVLSPVLLGENVWRPEKDPAFSPESVQVSRGLKAVYRAAKTSGQFSFEERMGCGFGACMGCSCKTVTGYKRICREGPVLEKEEILWAD